MTTTIKNTLLALLLMVGMQSLHAATLTIEITQGVEGALPIAIVPFGLESGKLPPEDIAAIVSKDLTSTGRFDAMNAKDMLAQPTSPEAIKFQNWRLMQREALVIGTIKAQDKGRYVANFMLFDVYKAKKIAEFNVNGTEQHFRALAHKISDIIYEKLTGQPGAFSTQIAYIIGKSPGGGSRHKVYSLWMADSDGYNEQILLEDSPEPILSPAWSPDGRKIAYVSLERDKQSRIVVQDLATGGKHVITVPIKNARQSAPAWSPDGKKLAFANHKNGNTDIYVIDLSSKKVSRLTRQLSIETEPTWTPDGQSIIFTSDRSGRPQLYKMPASGGRTTRITFEGVENAKPSVSADGKKLAMAHAIRNEDGVLEYKIAVMEIETGHLNVLTDGRLDESPSFAPNGSMIIYATTARRHGQERGLLAAVSVDGSVRQILNSDDEVWEPAWSPFNNK